VSAASPIKASALRGRVTRGEYGKGSKSEREAVFIETAQGTFLLRRKGGPAFVDPSLDQFIGHDVECDGFLVGTTLIADRIDIADTH
jgi:hypothetical protein